MAMATSKMVTPAFPAPHKQGCADPDTNEFSCDEMICSEFNMMMGGRSGTVSFPSPEKSLLSLTFVENASYSSPGIAHSNNLLGRWRI
jgi:hypothetical protein